MHTVRQEGRFQPNPELAGQGEGAALCLGRAGGLHPWGPSMGTHRRTALVTHGVLQPKLRWPTGLGACGVGWVVGFGEITALDEGA